MPHGRTAQLGELGKPHAPGELAALLSGAQPEQRLVLLVVHESEHVVEVLPLPEPGELFCPALALGLLSALLDSEPHPLDGLRL